MLFIQEDEQKHLKMSVSCFLASLSPNTTESLLKMAAAALSLVCALNLRAVSLISQDILEKSHHIKISNTF